LRQKVVYWYGRLSWRGVARMDWKIFFLIFFRSVILGIVLGSVALGLFGYLLAGKEGAINGAYWGAILGLIGGFFSAFVLIFARFWGNGGNYEKFPEYNWFVKKEDHNKPKD
jgi:hypothetical protein